MVWMHRLSRTAAAVGAAAALALLGPIAAANATDTPIDQPKMDELCFSQYPAASVYGGGFAYVVAPGDAYSWRCQQNAPNGSALANLGIDPAAYCSLAPGRGAAVLISAGSFNGWVCRTP